VNQYGHSFSVACFQPQDCHLDSTPASLSRRSARLNCSNRGVRGYGAWGQLKLERHFALALPLRIAAHTGAHMREEDTNVTPSGHHTCVRK